MVRGKRYRGYNIYKQDCEFIATCASGDEVEQFAGTSVESLRSAIDALWRSLGSVGAPCAETNLPSWYRDAIEAGEWKIRVPHAVTLNRNMVPEYEIQDLNYALSALADENGAVEADVFREVLEGFWTKHVVDDVRFRYEWNGKSYIVDAMPMTGQSLHFVVKDVTSPDGMSLTPSIISEF